MRGAVLCALALLAFRPTVARQSEGCSRIAATYAGVPFDYRAPLNLRARFEIRRCSNMEYEVLVYEAGAKMPALNSEIFSGWPKQLMHIRNILIAQTEGRESDRVYVFIFEQGKAKLALSVATKGVIRIRLVDNGKHVQVGVPTISSSGAAASGHIALDDDYQYAVEN